MILDARQGGRDNLDTRRGGTNTPDARRETAAPHSHMTALPSPSSAPLPKDARHGVASHPATLAPTVQFMAPSVLLKVVR